VSHGFFDVTGAVIRRGRLLTWHDDSTTPGVAVVNESFARRFTIVGVVPDVMARDVQERQDGVYLSILQGRPYGIRLMARAATDAASLMPSIRAALQRIDPDLPVTEVFPLREAVYRDKRILDVLSSWLLVFGVGALSLTAIALCGVVSFGVTQRRRRSVFGSRSARPVRKCSVSSCARAAVSWSSGWRSACCSRLACRVGSPPRWSSCRRPTRRYCSGLAWPSR
jgi:hypothetical protein